MINDEALKSLEDVADAHGWRPIVSAPKDGRPFLAWSETWDGTLGITIIWWVDDQSGWVSETNSICDWDDEDQPTHWHPLPEPPVETESTR